MARQGVGRRVALLGRLNPVIAKVCEWADRDPAAMRRVLEDAALRGHLLEALDDLAPASEPTDDARRQTA